MPNFTRGKSYDGTNIEAFIYANGPENIGANLLDTAAYGRAFTYYKLTPGKIYEAEFYKWNYSGKPIWVGVGLYNNTTNETASVTILKRASRYKPGSQINNVTNPSYNVGADMTLAFMNSNDQSNPTILPNTDYSTGGFRSLIEERCSAVVGLVNGRVRFKVNTGSNLYCKIYAVEDRTGVNEVNYGKRAGWANIVNANDLTKKDPGKDGTYNQSGGYTGIYSNIQRYASITNTNPFRFTLGKYSYNSSVQKEVVIDNNASGFNNTNEFEIPSGYLPFSKIGNQGNYGMVYAFYHTNANARKVTLTPRQHSSGRYVVKVNGAWRTIDCKTSSPGTFTLSGGTSFWFVLAGGNYGDVEVKYSLV